MRSCAHIDDNNCGNYCNSLVILTDIRETQKDAAIGVSIRWIYDVAYESRQAQYHRRAELYDKL